MAYHQTLGVHKSRISYFLQHAYPHLIIAKFHCGHGGGDLIAILHISYLIFKKSLEMTFTSIQNSKFDWINVWPDMRQARAPVK